MATDELLDIVDDQDRVLSRAPHSRVLRDYHIHRAVMFFVLDSEQRVLVSQRGEQSERDPASWSLALGGHVRAGESYDEAARRLIQEQTGIEARARPLTAFQKRTADERQNIRVYAVTGDGEPAIAIGGIVQDRFLTLAEINEMIPRFEFVPETPELLKMLVEHTSRRESPGMR